MTKTVREIIKIDEDKCNGCGACVPGCKEGALQIIDGKARLVSDVYCDGLGACLGTCPQDAITIVEREAEEFDEEAAIKHVEDVRNTKDEERKPLPCGCPGTMAKKIEPSKSKPATGDVASQLSQWPIQLTLIPANAPYLYDAEMVLLADCSAVAYPNLHRDFVAGKVIAMACPKLDDAEAHIEKLANLIEAGGPRSIEVVMMEVPCCSGLYRIAQEATKRAGKDVEILKKVISVEGDVIG